MNTHADPVRQLAELIARARPGWTTVDVMDVLTDPIVSTRTFWEVLAAAARCYGDPATAAPARLRLDGPWWKPGDTTVHQPRKSTLPPRFRGEHLGPKPGITPTIRTAIDQARTELANRTDSPIPASTSPKEPSHDH